MKKKLLSIKRKLTKLLFGKDCIIIDRKQSIAILGDLIATTNVISTTINKVSKPNNNGIVVSEIVKRELQAMHISGFTYKYLFGLFYFFSVIEPDKFNKFTELSKNKPTVEMQADLITEIFAYYNTNINAIKEANQKAVLDAMQKRSGYLKADLDNVTPTKSE